MSGTVYYIDHASMGDGAVGIIFDQDTKAVYTGLGVHTEDDPMAADISRLCGIHFFSDGTPEIPLYSVPYLEVLASDGLGGWFAMTQDFIRGPLYHIAPDRTVHLVTESYRNIFNLAIPDPDWRSKYLPGGPWPRLPEDPEGRRKLAEAFKLPSPPPDDLCLLDAPPRLFASRSEAEKALPIQDLWTVLRERKGPRFQVHSLMSPQDREGRAQVHYQAWLETYTGLMPESVLAAHTLEQCRKKANDHHYSNSTNTFVALDREDGDRVVGFGTLSCRAQDFVSVPEAGEIAALYVLKEFQGLGLGKDLLERCIAWIPWPNVVLFVLKGNDNAIRFYEHMGFRLTGHEIETSGMTELEMALEKKRIRK